MCPGDDLEDWATRAVTGLQESLHVTEGSLTFVTLNNPQVTIHCQVVVVISPRH